MVIEVRNIDFAYHKEPVLKDVSIKINNRQFTAFVGPNGSGKSTLIRCLNGILTPQKGSVLLGNKDVKEISRHEIAKKIAYVPQSDGKYLSASVYDVVMMGRKPYIAWSPGKKDHLTVIRVLKMLDLESIAMSNIRELSGGQQQRVYIARALAQEPEILLLDEPTASLDLKHIMDVLRLLRSLAKKEITVIMAIHDLNLAMRYCDHIIMLNNGNVFADGGTEIMTSENIQKLYGVEVKLLKDGDQMMFVPV